MVNNVWSTEWRLGSEGGEEESRLRRALVAAKTRIIPTLSFMRDFTNGVILAKSANVRH